MICHCHNIWKLFKKLLILALKKFNQQMVIQQHIQMDQL